MSRVVTALYDTRAEAETARARLQAEAGGENSRILGRDTIAALDSLKIAPADAARYREELQQGGHLLVADVPADKDPEQIIHLLAPSIGAPMSRGRETAATRQQPGLIIEEARIPQVQEELRIGKRTVERGGARVRSVVRETPAEERVSLRDEHLAVETRPAERRLTIAEVESAGLLKDRVIEVSEMREEPVINKLAVVREEVILKKEVTERVETVRETLRHTEVEVEELPGAKPALSGLGSGPGRERERGRT